MLTGQDIFGVPKAVVGMVHVGALPGTPRHTEPLDTILREAVEEAKLLAESGFDAVMIENMHDVPYLRRDVGPEIVASMAAIARAVRDAIDKPLGLQILAGAAGHTWGGTCEVIQVWVSETLRGRGVGRSLLEAVEEEARARGCHQILLNTHSFQAPDFYRQRGYAVLAQISG